MANIFLDIGGHRGQSVHQFYEEIDEASVWKIFSFEPVEFEALVSNTHQFHNVVCIKGVVGREDGIVDLFPVPLGGQGATILKGKTTGGVDYQRKEEVRCFDFVRWFKQNIKEGDFVIIKMNIEGGEYVLMPCLYEILPRIAGMHIKLHHNKFAPVEKYKLVKVYETFKKRLSEYKAFVFCDISENPYRFKWLIRKAYDKQTV